jgi:hypothetical protein
MAVGAHLGGGPRSTIGVPSFFHKNA